MCGGLLRHVVCSLSCNCQWLNCMQEIAALIVFARTPGSCPGADPTTRLKTVEVKTHTQRLIARGCRRKSQKICYTCLSERVGTIRNHRQCSSFTKIPNQHRSHHRSKHFYTLEFIAIHLVQRYSPKGSLVHARRRQQLTRTSQIVDAYTALLLPKLLHRS